MKDYWFIIEFLAALGIVFIGAFYIIPSYVFPLMLLVGTMFFIAGMYIGEKNG